MGIRSNVVIVLASLSLFACGGANSGGEAKGPETNPWADYKGTYATAGTPSAKPTKIAKAEEPKAEAPVEAPLAPMAAVEETPAPAPPPAPAKKAKGGGKGGGKKKKN